MNERIASLLAGRGLLAVAFILATRWPRATINPASTARQSFTPPRWYSLAATASDLTQPALLV